MFPNCSVFLPISVSKNPSFSRKGPELVIYSSTVKTLLVDSPVGRLPVGIILASGTNNVRILSQFLFCLAGPLITSYTAATIASRDETSFGWAGILSVSAVAFIVVQSKTIVASIIIFFMTLNFVQVSYCWGIYYSIHKSGFGLFTLYKFFY